MNIESSALNSLETSILTDLQFDQFTRDILAAIDAQIDAWLQNDVIDIDTHRTGGLLELDFGRGGKIIINTQPPLHELWLAARSGGYHFRWHNNQWIERQGESFHDVLSRCATEQGGVELRFI